MGKTILIIIASLLIVVVILVGGNQTIKEDRIMCEMLLNDYECFDYRCLRKVSKCKSK